MAKQIFLGFCDANAEINYLRAFVELARGHGDISALGTAAPAALKHRTDLHEGYAYAVQPAANAVGPMGLALERPPCLGCPTDIESDSLSPV